MCRERERDSSSINSINSSIEMDLDDQQLMDHSSSIIKPCYYQGTPLPCIFLMIKMMSPYARSRPYPGHDAIMSPASSSSIPRRQRRPTPPSQPLRRQTFHHLILLLCLSLLILLIQSPAPTLAQVQDHDHDHPSSLDLEHDPDPSFTTPCLTNTTSKHLNSIFSENGPSTRIILCQGSVVELTEPIIFTAKDQEIATEGYPEVEEKKATLRLMGGRSGTAVQ